MRMVFGLVLILGVALAGFAVYMAQGYIAQTQQERDALRAAQANAVQLSDVYVVNKPLKYGDALKAEDVVAIKWQANALPEGAFRDLATLFPEGRPAVRTVLRSMDKFEPVLSVKVTEPGEDAGITARLAKGMRAFAIRVDVSTGVSGFLRPGDRVDVYWSGNVAGQDMTRRIGSSISLLAIDQRADNDNDPSATIAKTVTVEVTPEQVAALAQAQTTGRLSLALVGSGDDSLPEGTVEIDQNRLLGIQPEVAAQVEVKKVCTIRTNKGGEIVETEIPCTN